MKKMPRSTLGTAKTRYILLISVVLTIIWVCYWLGGSHVEKDDSFKQEPIMLAYKTNEHKENQLISSNSVRIIDLTQHERTTTSTSTIFSNATNNTNNMIDPILQAIKENKNSALSTRKPATKTVPAGKPVQSPIDSYTLIHAGKASLVSREKQKWHDPMSDGISPDVYIFSSTRLPKNSRHRPTIGNGHVGTAIHSGQVFMNGIYSGEFNKSHRAVIPSTCSFNVTSIEPEMPFESSYHLNVAEGIYYESSIGKGFNITQRIYAHRQYTRVIVAEIELVMEADILPLKLKISQLKWNTSADISFKEKPSDKEGVSYMSGLVNIPETPRTTPQEIHLIYDRIPDELVPPSNIRRVKWIFLTSISTTKDEAMSYYEQASRLAKSHDRLHNDHLSAWASLWNGGRIDVKGNNRLARAIYSSYYNLLSSMPMEDDGQWPYIGLSPSGLPFGDLEVDYQGHVMWDQETWMYPAILPFHPVLAKILLQTRVRTREAAKYNARANKFEGLQYPWESAFTGLEVSNDPVFGKYEIHISGDITLAIQQYLQITGDVQSLAKDFTGIILEVAEYWKSRLVYDSQKEKYVINDVIPPDEMNKYVNNSVYTNAIAKLALEAPLTSQLLLGKTINRFQEYANNIYIPFDAEHNYHPEFEGYKMGSKVKQADTILLGFPIQYDMTQEVRKNDLKVYEKITDIGGPAMTWSMFAIGFLEVNEPKQATEHFKKYSAYIKNEFQVWTETSLGHGATNFLTGMGGFLQSVIYGYGGLRIRSNKLELNPRLPQDTEELHFIGLEYIGTTFDLYVVSAKKAMIRVTEKEFDAPTLKLKMEDPEEFYDLELHKPVHFHPRSCHITMQ